jgi:hypothetical protein
MTHRYTKTQKFPSVWKAISIFPLSIIGAYSAKHAWIEVSQYQSLETSQVNAFSFSGDFVSLSIVALFCLYATYCLIGTPMSSIKKGHKAVMSVLFCAGLLSHGSGFDGLTAKAAKPYFENVGFSVCSQKVEGKVKFVRNLESCPVEKPVVASR